MKVYRNSNYDGPFGQIEGEYLWTETREEDGIHIDVKDIKK